MCLSNVKHQCQKRLATLTSNGYDALIYNLVRRRQRRLICLLSQFKVDNSAFNLILFKQFSLISYQFGFLSSALRSSFLVNVKRQQSAFESLSRFRSFLNRNHCLYIFKLNKLNYKKQTKAHSDRARNKTNSLRRRHTPKSSSKPIKATTKQQQHIKKSDSRLLSEQVGKLRRRPNSIHHSTIHYLKQKKKTKKNQNCLNNLNNLNNLKRPTINDHHLLDQLIGSNS